MKPLLKPSSHSNLYDATMRSPSSGLPSRNQITRVDLRERTYKIRQPMHAHTPLTEIYKSNLVSRRQPKRGNPHRSVVQIRMGARFEQWLHGKLLLQISVSGLPGRPPVLMSNSGEGNGLCLFFKCKLQ